MGRETLRKGDGISYRLAKLSILFAIGLGLAASFVAIWFDYKNERNKIEGLTRQVLLVAAPSATEAAHQLDMDLATEVIAGLSSYQFIINASISDDSGNELARMDRPAADGPLTWVTRSLGDLFPTHKIDLWEATR